MSVVARQGRWATAAAVLAVAWFALYQSEKALLVWTRFVPVEQRAAEARTACAREGRAADCFIPVGDVTECTYLVGKGFAARFSATKDCPRWADSRDVVRGYAR